MSKVVPVFDYQLEVKQFVENGLWGDEGKIGECYCIGFANESEGLVAGIVYHNYDPRAGVIEISGYSKTRSWTNKKWVNLVFNFPFETWSIRILVGRHSENNKRVRSIWRKIGASEYVIPQLWGENESEAVAVLHRKVWEKSKFFITE